jgi:stage II sporulation protein R
VELGRYAFPAKGYGNLVFPAGNYEAVKVVLGRGEGANWWCVLFPPLCFVDISRSTSTAGSLDSQVSDVLAAGRRSGDDRMVVLRLKLVDWLRDKQSQLAGQGSS